MPDRVMHEYVSPELRPKRYRLEVYGSRDAGDYVRYYNTLRAARFNAWLVKGFGAQRVVVIDTEGTEE